MGIVKNQNVVGIDVSKDSLEVVFINGKDGKHIIKGSRTFTNDFKGYKDLLQWSLKKSKNESVHFIVEATGVYHENAIDYLYFNSQTVSVVLANKIKHYAKSLNIKTKNDKVDAKIIALYGLERKPEPWEPATKYLSEMRSLARDRLSYQKDITRLKNQQHTSEFSRIDSKLSKDLKRQVIEKLEESVVLIENALRDLTNQDLDFKRKIEQLETIKGISFITAITVVCETNGFRDISNIRKVVSYAGLDIAQRQSGKYEGTTRITKKGNSRIRQCLFMPALSAIQYNEPIKNLHQRIVERNPKAKRKGVIAGMRKLLILMFVLWKKDEPFNPNYNWNKK